MRIPKPFLYLIGVLFLLVGVYVWGEKISEQKSVLNTMSVPLEQVEQRSAPDILPLFEGQASPQVSVTGQKQTNNGRDVTVVSPFSVEVPTAMETTSTVPSNVSNGVPALDGEIGDSSRSSSLLTRIVVGKINLDSEVIETGWKEVMRNGVSTKIWVIPDNAVGWHNTSALPNQNGNIVLSGYNNNRGEVFRYVPDLDQGDRITLYLNDEPYQYTVTSKLFLLNKDQTETVRQQNVRWIGQTNEERVTLVTAWPYVNSTHLVVVVAKPLSLPSLADNPLPAAPDIDLPDGSVTEIGEGPSRIVAKNIGLDAPVIQTGWYQVNAEGTLKNVWEVPDYAAGWHKNSKLPNQNGNIVLSGHHNIKGQVFRYLVDLEKDDEIILYVEGQPYRYSVTEKLILKEKGEPPEVRRENARWIGPTNEERLTLVTCWPYSTNTHRLIIIAKPVLEA